MPIPTIPNLPVPSNPSHSILDSTKIQCYMECPRLFFYEYVLGWRSNRPNNHLVFGQALHLALEHVIINGYNSKSIDEAYQIFEACYRESFPENTDQFYLPKTPSRFFQMLILYCHHYQDDLSKYSVYKTEIGGTIPLGDSHQMAFKMDTVMYEESSGLYCSLEHKSKQGNYIDKSYEIDFKMGIQVGTYTHVLNSLFPPENVSGVIINCLCFKKTKQPEFIIKRFPINMSNQMMYIWLETVKTYIDSIYEDYNKLSITNESTDLMKCFKLNGKSCSNWGRVCQYNDLCTSWANPLRHLHQMPISMDVNFWNPLEEDLNEVINF